MNAAPSSVELEFLSYDRLDAIGPGPWNELWTRTEAPSVFARYEWADAWWRSFGHGRAVRLYAVRESGRLVGLLPIAWPLAASDGPAVLVGDEHADYAGILMDRTCPGIFGRLLERACGELGAASGLLVRDVRGDSSYAGALADIAAGRFSRWRAVSSIPCPRTTLDPERLQALVNKQSLKRHARQLAQRGQVEVRHMIDSDAILPCLEGFFAQHVARWQGTDSPSLFLAERNRNFYRDLAIGFSGSGQLVYTEIRLDARPVACHFGFVSEGDFIWYKPSFAPDLAQLSPGETLLRELLLYAHARGLRGFDFTRGGEAFKRRFADAERTASTFMFHPSRSGAAIARGQSLLRSLARTQVGQRVRRWVRPVAN
jgi:CelD/BcsL family acetyltransferase involved in cellulose biosynthesis